MSLEGIGEAMEAWMVITIVLAILAIFGVWKVIEIVIWLFSHVRFV